MTSSSPSSTPLLGASIHRPRGARFLIAAIVAAVLAVWSISGDIRAVWMPGDVDGLEATLGRKTKGRDATRFTIVTPTYKRDDLLPAYLDRYASGKIPSLDGIVLIWIDQASAPPQWLRDHVSSLSVPVTIRIAKSTSLNERFRPEPDVRTDAVLALDDDVKLEPEVVEKAFQAFREYGQGRKRMVGFVPRETVRDDQGRIGYTYQPLDTYSMILTKASFLHVDWHTTYWSERFKSLRSYVDSETNCEDILMSFLYASTTQLAPLYLDVPISDHPSMGLSLRPQHNEGRSKCVRDFVDMMGGNPLVSTSWQLSMRVGVP